MNGGKISEKCVGRITARQIQSWKTQAYWVHCGRLKFGRWEMGELMNVETEEQKSVKA